MYTYNKKEVRKERNEVSIRYYGRSTKREI